MARTKIICRCLAREDIEEINQVKQWGLLSWVWIFISGDLETRDSQWIYYENCRIRLAFLTFLQTNWRKYCRGRFEWEVRSPYINIFKHPRERKKKKCRWWLGADKKENAKETERNWKSRPLVSTLLNDLFQKILYQESNSVDQ